MSENLAPHLAAIIEALTALRAATGRIERNQSDPEEIRQALSDIASSWVLIGQMAEVLRLARDELLTFRAWREDRMSGPELKDQLESLGFVTRQIGGALQSYRDDILLMRADIRRLSAQQEVALSQLATDEEPSRVPDDVRAVLHARRSSRQRLNMILVAVLGARHMQEEPPDLTDELRALSAADGATVAAIERLVGATWPGVERRKSERRRKAA